MKHRDTKSESRAKRVLHLAKRVFVYMGSVWVLTVLLFRFVNPPITPLIAIRSAEYTFEDRDVPTRWEWVPLASIPLHVQQSIVAAEDARFMEHWGIDVSAVGEAIEESDDRRRGPRGASTITMQTVKNVFLWPGRSYWRKVIEGVMAPIAGVLWGKRRTLEIYLNVIEWGEGIYGIQAASEYYFDRSVGQLSLEQAAALASILPSPRKLSPKNLSVVSRQRFDRIIREASAVPLPLHFYSRAAARSRGRS